MRVALPVLLAVLGLAVAAGPAAAGPIVDSAPDCDEQRLSKPFLRWVDPANYTPLAGGGFEDGARRWTFDGHARVVAGNEPWAVAGEGHHRSLSLPDHASATSGSICVGLEHPTLRFFARRTSGSPLSVLSVEVLFETAWETVGELEVASVLGSGTWGPTLPLPVVVNLLPLLPGERTAIAFRFTAQGGDWQIDDVFVDPWRAR